MTELAIPLVSPPALTDTTAPLRIGSEEHKRALCYVMMGHFDAYKPAIIDWPVLSPDAKQRLTSLPFWDIAVHTEGYASIRMQAMADSTQDPLVKEAIALNAFEEKRHKHVLHHMLNFYQIKLAPEPPYKASKDAEWDYIYTGFGECVDSFFAFGLFKMAKNSGYFPHELVDVFEPVVQEEGRHILFFVNWVAWNAANLPLQRRLWFRLRCLAAWVRVGWDRMSIAGTADKGSSGDNFVITGGETLTANLTLRALLETALEEDKKRMAIYDPRLLRPAVLPFFARIALKFVR